MNMEGPTTTKSKEKISQRLWIANEASLRLAVKEIKVTGKENIKEIPEGAKVVIMTTHLNDLSVPAAIHAVAQDLDVVVLNESTHHKFGGDQGEIPMNIGMRVAGKDNFLPIDFHKDESGKKSPGAFNPENFTPAVEALDKGRSVMIAAHNPSEGPMKNLDGVKGGYGGVYLASLTDAYILPITTTLSRNVMDGYNLKGRPDASVIVGKPFKLERIEGIEHFAEITKKRENGEKITEEERQEFLRLANALRERSALVIKLMSEQLTTQPQKEEYNEDINSFNKNNMPSEFQPKTQGSLKKIEDAELTYKGEQAMTPKQTEFSAEREEGFSHLSPEQTTLLKECNLTLKWRGPGFGGSGGGGTEIIKGTIEGGKKLEIYFTNLEGISDAKIDGKSVSQEESKNLLNRYYAIAKVQTGDSSRAKEANENPTIKAIREKILGFLDK
jgi:hypothetical protein